MKRLITLTAAVILLSACGKDSTPSLTPAAEGAAPISVDPAVLARIGDASVFETAAAKPYAALGCARGEVEELDVLVCHYTDAAAADTAAKSLREFVAGALSGVVRQAGPDLLAIADRKEVDPKGERISRLTTAFAPEP